MIEDTENREKLSKLLRFYSSQAEEELTSLDAYVGRMKPGQKAIYYMAADNMQVCVCACTCACLYVWNVGGPLCVCVCMVCGEGEPISTQQTGGQGRVRAKGFEMLYPNN